MIVSWDMEQQLQVWRRGMDEALSVGGIAA